MRYFTALLAIVALSTLARPAHAAMFGAEVYGNYNTYAMDDWNDLLNDANQSGANFDEINGGIAGGIGLRMWASPNVMIAATWEPLFASTDDSGTELNLDANSFLATVAYMVPVGERAKYGIGVGGGIYTISGELKDPTETFDLSGSGGGFHVLGLAEWNISPGFGVTAGAGYRMAKIDDTKANDMSATPKFETDYSGFTGRVGVAFYLPNGQ